MSETILELADLDEQLGTARDQLANPPSQREAAEAEQALEALIAQKRALDEQAAPLRDRVASLEGEIEGLGARREQIAGRLASSTGAGRELERMEEERRSIAEHIERLETELLEVLEQLEPMEERDARLRDDARAAIARRDEARQRADGEREEATRRIGELEARRTEPRGRMEPALLERYERIATRLSSSGAARIADGRCSGCHVALANSVTERAAREPLGSTACEECGRILVP